MKQFSTGVIEVKGFWARVLGGIPPNPPGGTLTPFIPLSLRAYKGEGEEKTEGSACAMAQALPSSLVLGRKEGKKKRSRWMCSVNVCL